MSPASTISVSAPETWRFPFNRLTAFDARDWDAIAEWAAEIAAKLQPVAA